MFQLVQSYWITLTIGIGALIAFTAPELVSTMELDTRQSLIPQIPQIFTCHLLHWSGEHLFWDLLMFVVVGALCEKRARSVYSALLFVAAISIPLVVTFFVPAVDSYRGLSGLDTAIFAFAAIVLIRESQAEMNWGSVAIYSVLFAGMLVKIAYELLFDATMFVDSSDFSPVPVAHVAGAALGIVFALGWIKHSNFRHRNSIDKSIFHSPVSPTTLATESPHSK